jgi:hypothetical protein
MLLWTPPTVVPDAAIQWYVLTSQSSNPADSTFKVTAAPGATRSNYHFTGLNTASAYTFGIRAVNCPGWSDTRFTSSVSFASIYTSSLILWVDSRNAASYPGSGAAWSNLATRYSTAVRMSLVNSPTTSNVTYNGVTVAGMSFNGTNQYAVNNASLQTYLDANSKRETREMWLYWRGGNSVFQSELGAQVGTTHRSFFLIRPFGTDSGTEGP